MNSLSGNEGDEDIQPEIDSCVRKFQEFSLYLERETKVLLYAGIAPQLLHYKNNISMS